MATVTLLTLKSDFWRHQNLHWSGTATGGGTDYLTDTALINLPSETFPTPLMGHQMRVTAGAASGDLRQVVKVGETLGRLYVNTALTGTPVSGDAYEMWGNAIHGGTLLTNLFNDTLRRLHPITQTEVTIVTNQAIYDIGSVVSAPEDVIAVYLRRYDAGTDVTPYRPERIWAKPYLTAGAGTASVVNLELANKYTVDTDVRKLFVEHWGTFAAFSSDTSTVDAIYRDWIAWETVLRFARRMAASNRVDKDAWAYRAAEAARECKALRARHRPRKPIFIPPHDLVGSGQSGSWPPGFPS